MDDDTAIQKVKEFVECHGYQGRLMILGIGRCSDYTDVFLFSPFGLFTVRPDGSVEEDVEYLRQMNRCS